MQISRMPPFPGPSGGQSQHSLAVLGVHATLLGLGHTIMDAFGGVESRASGAGARHVAGVRRRSSKRLAVMFDKCKRQMK